jgi:hypothetical protein
MPTVCVNSKDPRRGFLPFFGGRGLSGKLGKSGKPLILIAPQVGLCVGRVQKERQRCAKRDRGREMVREGGRQGGRQGGREGTRERGREGGRQRGRYRRSDGGEQRWREEERNCAIVVERV